MKFYKGYILDMDGVTYRGDEPIQEAVEVVNVLKDRGHRVLFITNNSAKLAGEYREILSRIGITPVEDEHIITSGDVTANYLQRELREYPERKRVLCIAGDSMKYLLKKAGMEIIRPEDYREAHYVLVGLYHDFN